MDKFLLETLELEYQKTLDEVSEAMTGGQDALKKLDLLQRHLDVMEKQRIENERLEMAKAELEIRTKELDLKRSEAENKRESEKRDAKDRKIQMACQTGVGVFGTIATLLCWRKALKFEETGAFTSRSANVIGSIKKLFGK